MSNGASKISGVNFQQVAIDPSMSAITRQTAQNLLKNPYMTPADFFRGLTNSDLTVLSIMMEMMNTDEESLENLLLLSLMLAAAEGVAVDSEEEARSNLHFLCIVITGESLKRKGLVDINYDKLSFGADMAREKIMSLREGIDPADLL